MKREIKFRAWDGFRMHYDFQFIKSGNESNDWILFISDKQTLKDDWKNNPFFQAQIEVLQFTGAFDCLGDEIYEGDIIEFDPREWGDNKTNVFKVYWDEYEHGWCFGGGGQQGDMEWRTVIGNIYENPELLK